MFLKGNSWGTSEREKFLGLDFRWIANEFGDWIKQGRELVSICTVWPKLEQKSVGCQEWITLDVPNNKLSPDRQRGRGFHVWDAERTPGRRELSHGDCSEELKSAWQQDWHSWQRFIQILDLVWLNSAYFELICSCVHSPIQVLRTFLAEHPPSRSHGQHWDPSRSSRDKSRGKIPLFLWDSALTPWIYHIPPPLCLLHPSGSSSTTRSGLVCQVFNYC